MSIYCLVQQCFRPSHAGRLHEHGAVGQSGLFGWPLPHLVDLHDGRESILSVPFGLVLVVMSHHRPISDC